MARTNSYDLKLIIELIHLINFFKSSMEEHVLVAVIEQELAKHFEFQATHNMYSAELPTWEYYIRRPLKYPNLISQDNPNRLLALLLNLEFLRDTAINKE